MNIKRIFALILACVMCLSILAGCSNPVATPTNMPTDVPTEAPTEPPVVATPLPKDKEYVIMFIGNSYTYRNQMPDSIFRWIASSAGYKTKIKYITNGAHTLQLFASPTDEYGARVHTAFSADHKGEYDFVILQEQSVRPTTETAKFYDGARDMVSMIRAVGATPVFYMTWGRKEGNSELLSRGWKSEHMTWLLANAYTAIGEELDALVAPVGLGFLDVYKNEKSIDLYDADGSHPSYEGSYLTALILFAKIFNADPTQVTFNGKLTADVADTLKAAAKEVVDNTPEIPAEYKSSSVGVTKK